jgi:hypothetical protein
MECGGWPTFILDLFSLWNDGNTNAIRTAGPFDQWGNHENPANHRCQFADRTLDRHRIDHPGAKNQTLRSVSLYGEQPISLA